MTDGLLETSIVPEKKPRKERKRSPRKLKNNGKRKHTKSSEHFKKLWADPVWGAREREKLVMRNRARAGTKLTSRVGIPDGMHAEEAALAWEKARELARKFIKIMEDNNEVEKTVIPGSEAEMAKRVLEEAFVMAVSPLGDAKTKNTAIRTVLDFTKAKPESRSKLTLTKAEDWLSELAQDMGGDDEAPAE